jgi:hypothetical protein
VPSRFSLGKKNTPPQAVGGTANYEFAVKPQMKKYRCPWCMSTKNHNILYFVCISSICPLNTAICLWKAQTSLSWRGFRGQNCPQIGANSSLSVHASPIFQA